MEKESEIYLASTSEKTRIGEPHYARTHCDQIVPKRAPGAVRPNDKYWPFHHDVSEDLAQKSEIHKRIIPIVVPHFMEIVEPAGGIERSIWCIRCNYSSIELRRQNLSNALLLYLGCLCFFGFLNPAGSGSQSKPRSTSGRVSLYRLALTLPLMSRRKRISQSGIRWRIL
jgi:hypothetical protein